MTLENLKQNALEISSKLGKEKGWNPFGLQTCSQWFLPGKAYYHNLRKTLVMISTSVKVNRSQEAPQDKKRSLFIYLSIYLSISEGWTNQWDNFSVTLSFMLMQSSDIKICLLHGHEFQRSYIFLTNRSV